MATENLSLYKKVSLLNIENIKVAIVTAQWNNFITNNLRDGAHHTLLNEGVLNDNIMHFNVPGTFELSFACKQLCQTERYDAVITIGSVIRGETAHFEYVCSAVAMGIKDCNIQTNTPAIFCVLTDDNREQAIARSGGALGNKGIEAAATALQMIQLKQEIK